MYQHRDVNEIEQQLNNDFGNGSLTINEAYTLQRIKPNLFFLQVIVKFYLHVKYKNIKIKQHSLVTYRGCVLDETLCGEPMALKALNKINGKLKFLYHKFLYVECYATPLSSHILIMPALHGTLT